MRKSGHLLHQLSGWLLLACMLAAPWGGGSLPPRFIYALLEALAGCIVCWIAGLLLLRRRPVFNIVSGLGALLLAQGWIMALNPVSRYAPDKHLFYPEPHLPWLPGSVDGFSSLLAMASFTVLFLVFHLVLDHCRGDVDVAPSLDVGRFAASAGAAFRRRLLWTAALTGAAIAATGATQHLRLILAHQPIVATAFGPFHYHANASSFLLLTLTSGAGLAAFYFVSGRRLAALASALLALVVLTGILLNSTRAADLIVIIESLLFGIGSMLILHKISLHVRRRSWIIVTCLLLVMVGIFAFTVWIMPGKWQLLIHQMLVVNPRTILWRIVAAMAGDAGALGYGPNTFSLLFPVSPHFNPRLYSLYILTFHTPGQQMSMWSNAHLDLLQAIVEWGWLGAAVWVAMTAATLAAALRELCNWNCPAATRLILLAPFAGLVALFLHSLMDFPLQLLVIQLYCTAFAAFIWSLQHGRRAGGTLRTGVRRAVRRQGSPANVIHDAEHV
jgi:hypothetical protein